MSLKTLFVTVSLGTLVVFVTDAPTAILGYPQKYVVLIVAAMEILIAACQDHVILVQGAASFVLTILRVMSVSFVDQGISGMPQIRVANFVIVMMVAQPI